MATCAAAYEREAYEEAYECFGRLMKRLGPRPVLLYAQGYCAYGTKRYEKAAQIFALMRRLSPRDGDALFMSGMTAYRRERYREAAEFLRQALRVGLRQESPKEARETLALIQKTKKKAKRRAFHMAASVAVGYDSRPRVSGAAFDARTNTWSATQGSGYLDVKARVGYRWRWRLPKPRRFFLGDVDFAFRQLLVFTDFEDDPTGRRMRDDVELTPLSLQSHELSFRGGFHVGKFVVALSAAADFELLGVHPMEPFVVGGDLGVELGYRWVSWTSSWVAGAFRPQRSLHEDYAYLSGQSFGFKVAQRFVPLSWLRVDVGYELGRWRLGRFEIQRTECPRDGGCLLESSFSSLSHRGEVSVRLSPLSWLRVRGSAALSFRRFDTAAVFWDSPQEVSLVRQDLLQHYGVEVDARLAPSFWVGVGYGFSNNHSNVTLSKTGLDERYTRHVVQGRVLYRR